MSRIPEEVLLAFQREIKTAAPNWHSILGSAGALGGTGAALGGAGGALIGGYRAHRQAKEQGADGMGAGVSALSGALGGASRGAMLGAGAGVLAGAGAGALKSNVAQKLVDGNYGIASSGARFGQRQLHALTGWTPKAGLESIRAGTYEARERLGNAVSNMGTGQEVERAEKALAAADKAKEMGLTNVPGYVKSLRDNGVMNTLRADVKNQWDGVGTGTKALMIGAPALGLAGAAMTPESVEAEGMGKGERIGRSIGQTAGGVLGSPMPILGQQVVGGVLSGAGGMLGRGVDRLRGVKPGSVG